MNEEYVIRRAQTSDIPFIVKTIVEAEKSMTSNLGLAKFFNMSQAEVEACLHMILEEEIDGCEFSLSSYIVAEYNGVPVASMGGWIEGQPDDLSSSIVKGNLISFCFPRENVLSSISHKDVMQSIQIPREMGSFQIEYSYTEPEHRGKRIISHVIDELIKNAKASNAKKVQVHVFENNEAAIKAYKREGFEIIKRYESTHPETRIYFPGNVELLMEKKL